MNLEEEMSKQKEFELDKKEIKSHELLSEPQINTFASPDNISTDIEKKSNEEVKNKRIEEENKRFNDKYKSLKSHEKIMLGNERNNLTFRIGDYIKEMLDYGDISYDRSYDPKEGVDLINSQKYNFLSEEQKDDAFFKYNMSEKTLSTFLNNAEHEYESFRTSESAEGADNLYNLTGYLMDPLNYIGGTLAYNAGVKATMHLGVNKGIMHTGTFIGTETLGSAAVEFGLYATDEYRTIEQASIDSLLGGLIGGPLSIYARKSDLSSLPGQLEWRDQVIDKLNKKITKSKNKDSQLLDKENYTVINENGNNKVVLKKEVEDALNIDTYALDVRFDNYAKMIRDAGEDEDLKRSISKYFLDSTSLNQESTVEEISKNIIDGMTSEMGYFQKSLNKNYKKSIEENPEFYNKIYENNVNMKNINVGETLTRILRKLNNEDIAYNEVPSIYKEIIDKHTKKYNKMIREEYKKAGIEIAEGEDFYIRTIMNMKSTKEAINIIPEKQLNLLFKESLFSKWQKMGIEINSDSIKIANKVSKAYYKRMKKNIQYEGQLRVQDMEALSDIKEILEELRTSNSIKQSEYDDMVSKMEVKSGPSISKRKIKMDYYKEVNLLDKNGNPIKLKVADLLENDFDKLSSGTFRKAISDAKFRQNSTVKMNGKEYDLTDEFQLNSFAQEGGESVKKFLRMMEHLKNGAVKEEKSLNGLGNTISKTFRNFSTMTYMGQVFFSQFPEIGMVLGTNSITRTLKDIPEISKLYKNMALGKLSADELDFMDSVGWLLTKSSNRTLKNILLDEGEESLTNISSAIIKKEGSAISNIKDKTLNALDKVETASEIGADWVISKFGGIKIMTTVPKLLAFSGYLKNWTGAVHKGKIFLSDKRIAELGITKLNYEEINKLMLKHSTPDMSMIELMKSIDKWEDKALKDIYLNAINRKINKIVLDGTMGEGVEIFENNIWGKMFTQFLNFVSLSYSKNFLSGMRHVDNEMLTTYMGSFALASIGQMSRIHSNYSGNEEKLKERMKLENLGWNTISATTQLGLPAMITSTALGMFGVNITSHRSSGLSQTIVGNPAFGKAEQLSEFFTKIGSEDNLGYSDFKFMIPNMVLINAYINSEK